MEFQPDGKLYVVDSFHGLYSIDVSSGKTELIWDISHDIIGASKVGFPNYFAILTCPIIMYCRYLINIY